MSHSYSKTFQASRNTIQFYFTLHTFCFMHYVGCQHMQNLMEASSVKKIPFYLFKKTIFQSSPSYFMVSPFLFIDQHKHILRVSQGIFQNFKANRGLTFTLQPTLTKQCTSSFSSAHMPCNENNVFFVCVLLIAQFRH